MSELTRLFEAIDRGEPCPTDRILPLVYDELRQMAARQLSAERPGQTLQATALVHEAYLRLLGPQPSAGWKGRGHFFSAAAEAMRRILVENARRRRGPRRGGRMRRLEIDPDRLAIDPTGIDVLAIDESLARLEAESPARAELVKLRFFAGLTTAEAAEALGISVATAERYWAYARARLFADLAEPTG